MTHIPNTFTGKPQGLGLDPTQQTTQSDQTQSTSNNRLSRRGNNNTNRVRTNQPSRGAKFLKGIKTGLTKAWNSRFCVGSGHTIQGFLGISAFRGAYNRASGNTEQTTNVFKTQYQPTRREPQSEYSNKSGTTTRTKDQAKWAGHGATTGISMSIIVGFVPSIVGGILGGVCGGATRLFKGAPLANKSDLKQIRNSDDSKFPTSNLQNKLEKLNSRVADIICDKEINSVQDGLELTHKPPAKARFTKYSGDQLPAKQSVREYQAFCEHAFDPQLSRENQDFRLGQELLRRNPTKENFDFMFDNFIVDNHAQGININTPNRNNLLGLTERADPNDRYSTKVKMTDNAFNQLQTAVEKGVGSNEFQNLPSWMQTALRHGMEDRGSNELSMVDVFNTADREIRSLMSNDTMKKLSDDLI